MVLAVHVLEINSLTQKSDVLPEKKKKRTTGGRGRETAISSAVKANNCFLKWKGGKKALNSYRRGRPFKGPSVFKNFTSAADVCLRTLVHFQPVFEWWLISFYADVLDFCTSATSRIYSFRTIICWKHFSQFIGWKISTRISSTPQP